MLNLQAKSLFAIQKPNEGSYSGIGHTIARTSSIDQMTDGAVSIIDQSGSLLLQTPKVGGDSGDEEDEALD